MNELKLDNFIQYSFQEGEQEANVLTLHKNGTVEAFIRSAKGNSVPRALGWYFMSLAQDDVDAQKVWQLIQQHNLSGASQSAPRFFGMRLKRFFMSLNGQMTNHELNAFAPIPDKFRELEQSLLQLLARVSEWPLRSFQMACVVPSEVVEGQVFRVDLQLNNDGKFPAEIRNPASFATGGNDALQLHLWEKLANGELSTEVITIDLAGNEFLIREREALPSDAPFVTIPPHGSVRVWVSIRPRLAPAAYEGLLVCYTRPYGKGELEAHNHLIVGEYHAEPVTFRIKAKVPVSGRR